MSFKFILSVLYFRFLFAIQGNANVPALYVFGDSLVDVGNNNYLPFSFLKANFPHNGIDFPAQNATGRFSNGKNPADFLADKLGLVSPPPFLSILANANITEIFMKGVNFASAGAGVLDSTREGQCLKLSRQIDYYSELYMNLLEKFGNAKAQYHISKSMFLLVVGSNDILDYVKKPYDQRGVIASNKLLDVMISSLHKHIKKLHDLGARKIAFVGTGPIGCCPAQRRNTSLNACNSETNSISVRYNNKVASLLHDMILELKSLSFSFFNSSSKFEEYIDKPADYGFSEAKSACCGIGDLNAEIGCIPISSLCPSRKSFVFWDLYHPTEATAGLLIDTLYNGSLEYVYPINVRQLSEL